MALPQAWRRNIYEALWLGCIGRYRGRAGSSVGDPGPLVLTLLAVDLSLPPLDLSSLMAPPFSFIFMTIGFPFLPSRSYFCFPFRPAGPVTSVAIFLNRGVVAFQPSATSEVFSARHFLLLRVAVGLIAGQETSGQMPPPQSWGLWWSSRVAFPPLFPNPEPGGCLARCTARSCT